jgi:hypothetical protein
MRFAGNVLGREEGIEMGPLLSSDDPTVKSVINVGCKPASNSSAVTDSHIATMHITAWREGLCDPIVRIHLPQSAFVSCKRTM